MQRVRAENRLGAGMSDPRFIDSIKDLTPQPCGAHVQMLPNGHILLNPTEVELKIIALYIAELHKIKPPPTDCIAH